MGNFVSRAKENNFLLNRIITVAYNIRYTLKIEQVFFCIKLIYIGHASDQVRVWSCIAVSLYVINGEKYCKSILTFKRISKYKIKSYKLRNDSVSKETRFYIFVFLLPFQIATSCQIFASVIIFRINRYIVDKISLKLSQLKLEVKFKLSNVTSPQIFFHKTFIFVWHPINLKSSLVWKQTLKL